MLHALFRCGCLLWVGFHVGLSCSEPLRLSSVGHSNIIPWNILLLYNLTKANMQKVRSTGAQTQSSRGEEFESLLLGHPA
jgi:hypothetical protein